MSTSADVPGTPTGGVLLRPLSVVDEGDDVLVGDVQRGRFVAMPRIGGFVIRAFQRGESVEQVSAAAEREAGEPVDLAAFVETLRRLGFLADPAIAEPAAPVRTAPIQQRRWIAALPSRYARRLFGGPAWIGYGAALAFCVGCFALVAGLRPWPAHLADSGYAVIVALLVTDALTAVHEAWHWLAARALGLSARFGVDRRLFFLVFETDLSQLWSVPRRRRYGPQLAGLAVDGVSLAAILATRLALSAGWLPSWRILADTLTALTFFRANQMAWQCLVFLRTDLYGVLVTALGCRNLWRVKTLLIHQLLGRLRPEQERELAAADRRDIRVGRWFRWVYLAGVPAVFVFAGYVVVPAIASMVRWSHRGLSVSPGHASFWLTLIGSIVLYLPLATALGLWVSGSLRRGLRLVRRPDRTA
jgi:putative peptide zinc metalloprotease protein